MKTSFIIKKELKTGCREGFITTRFGIMSFENEELAKLWLVENEKSLTGEWYYTVLKVYSV